MVESVCVCRINVVPTQPAARFYHLARPQFRFIISLACLGVIRPGGRETGFRTDGKQEKRKRRRRKSAEECLSDLTSHKNPWYALAYNQIIVVTLSSLITAGWWFGAAQLHVLRVKVNNLHTVLVLYAKTRL